MANTYTQIHIQTIFAVRYRANIIQREWKEELYKYITGIIQQNDHRVIAINGMEDHIHIFIGMRPTQSLSHLMQTVKASSSKWINERKFLNFRFEWQDGYGAFSYSKSQVGKVITYIQNQEAHHKRLSFLEEYKILLDRFSVSYDERYVFKFPC